MSRYNPDFWEIQVGQGALERISATNALWAETPEDRELRHAQTELFKKLLPVVIGVINTALTQRQREILQLHYIDGKTQGDIAIIMELNQSTISRHLFGTIRKGKRTGGAIPKLQKHIKKINHPDVAAAFEQFEAAKNA